MNSKPAGAGEGMSGMIEQRSVRARSATSNSFAPPVEGLTPPLSDEQAAQLGAAALLLRGPGPRQAVGGGTSAEPMQRRDRVPPLGLDELFRRNEGQA